LAPKLWFYEAVESAGMYVVGMDYIEGRCVDDVSLVPLEVCMAVGSEAIMVLHDDLLSLFNLFSLCGCLFYSFLYTNTTRFERPIAKLWTRKDDFKKSVNNLPCK